MAVEVEEERVREQEVDVELEEEEETEEAEEMEEVMDVEVALVQAVLGVLGALGVLEVLEVPEVLLVEWAVRVLQVPMVIVRGMVLEDVTATVVGGEGEAGMEVWDLMDPITTQPGMVP